MRLGDYFLLLLYRLVPQRYYLTPSRKISPGKTLLDVGGARGRLSELLEDKFELLVILDVLEKHFPARKSDNMEFLVASGCFLPIRGGSMDAVVFHDSLHHLESPLLGLREALRVLSLEGKLYIFDFNRETPLGRIILVFEKLMGFPAKLLTVQELKDILEAYGDIWVEDGRLGSIYLMLVKTREYP